MLTESYNADQQTTADVQSAVADDYQISERLRVLEENSTSLSSTVTNTLLSTNDMVEGYYNTKNGVDIITSSDYKTSDFISVKSETLFRSWKGGYIYKYDSDKNFIGVLNGMEDAFFKYTIDTSIAYLKFVVPMNEGVDLSNLYISWKSLIKYEDILDMYSSWDKSGSSYYTKDLKFYVIGDSITAGENAKGSQYFTHFQDMCGFSKVTADGIGGTCVSTGEDNDFISRLPKIPTDTDIIMIFGGTNDWGHHHILGSFDNTSSDTSTFYGACKNVVEYLLTNYNDKQIFFVTPIQRNVNYYPADNMNRGNNLNKNGNTLDEYVSAMKEVCAYYSIPCLDLYHNSFSGRDEATKANYITDGLHPNPSGHMVLARKISKFINYTL